MANVKTYTSKGKESGEITLPEKVFGVKWNANLVHQVITSLMSSKRMGTAHAKTRGEVRGGGKKPWKQKGTGRARSVTGPESSPTVASILPSSASLSNCQATWCLRSRPRCALR